MLSDPSEGMPLATDGNFILVGAQSNSADGISGAGQVQVYARSPGSEEGWVYTGALESPAPQYYGRFGWSIFFHQDIVLVSAAWEDRPDGGEGIVYFDNNSVVKIMIILYGDIGSRKIAVYYRNQKIVRISDLLNKYDSNVHEGNVKISEKEFTDYYFSNSKLLTILKNHKNDENKVNDEESELEKTLELIDKVKVKI